MRNLKKVLSLVLCVAMMLSVMVVGAGAAFSDQSKIKNTEAVDACTALNIIGGYPDGSFKPEGNITRAEVTKMICVALNGGKEPNLATNATPTFSDVRTNANSAWAEKYIESCASQGIVSGVGAGKFAPAGNVTGTQLAKMLLVALGYKSENEGFTGNAWATNVNTIASAKGLYAGLETIDPSAAITRDNAAQMVWNAMNAYEVEYKTSLIADKDGKLSTQITVQDKLGLDGKSKITLLEDKYDAIAVTGTLTQVKQDKGKSTYSITVTDPKYNGKEYNGGDPISYTDVTKDYSDLLYQNVRVLVKPDNNGKDAVVYGVYATNKNTTQTGILKNLKMDGNKAKLDGTKYDLASKQTVYVNGDVLYKASTGFTTDSSKAEKDNNQNPVKATIKEFVNTYGDDAVNASKESIKYTDPAYFQPTEVSLIATDGTSNYSILKVKTFAVGKVTAVGSDYINVTVKKGDTSISTKTKLENDDWNWYSGVKKDDYVILTAAGNYGTNKGLVEKATVVSGKVTGTKSTDGVYVAGNWYTMAGKKSNGTPAVDRPNTGSNVEMVVVNGYVYYTDTTAGNVDDMALLVAAAPKGGTGSKWEARLVLADGSDKTVTIEKYWDDKDNKSFPIMAFAEGNTANSNMTYQTSERLVASKEAPMLVSYTVSGDVYTLSRVGVSEINKDGDTYTEGAYATNGYDVYASVGATNVKTDGSIKSANSTAASISVKDTKDSPATTSKLYYESTGVVFVKYKADRTGDSADYKVVTGKVASSYDKELQGAGAAAVANKSGNSYYAQVGFIDLGTQSTGGGSDKYAVVTDDVEKDTSSSTMYIIKAWTGTEEVTIKTDDSAVKNLSGGALISYSGDINNADVTVKTEAKNYYVSNYDSASGDISLLSGTLTEDTNVTGKYTGTLTSPGSSDKYSKVDSKDTTVIFVNSDDSKGVSGLDYTNIDLAYAFDSDFCTTTNSGDTYTIIGLSEDATPNVKAFFDDDDQITVLVVDVNRNITQW